MLFSFSCNLHSVRIKNSFLIGYGPRIMPTISPRITPRRKQKITPGTKGNLRNGGIKISHSDCSFKAC